LGQSAAAQQPVAGTQPESGQYFGVAAEPQLHVLFGLQVAVPAQGQQVGPVMDEITHSLLRLHEADWQVLGVGHWVRLPLVQQPGVPKLALTLQVPVCVVSLHVPTWHFGRPAVQSRQARPHDVLPAATQLLAPPQLWKPLLQLSEQALSEQPTVPLATGGQQVAPTPARSQSVSLALLQVH
jgi:hypothetical protein